MMHKGVRRRCLVVVRAMGNIRLIGEDGNCGDFLSSGELII
jgi:hypothetical protein